MSVTEATRKHGVTEFWPRLKGIGPGTDTTASDLRSGGEEALLKCHKEGFYCRKKLSSTIFSIMARFGPLYVANVDLYSRNGPQRAQK